MFSFTTETTDEYDIWRITQNLIFWRIIEYKTIFRINGAIVRDVERLGECRLATDYLILGWCHFVNDAFILSESRVGNDHQD